jgi:cation:H+ antiporter
MLLPNLAYFAVACIFLAVSSIVLVKLLKKLAILLHITDFAAAFVIMAAATSLPELFVGITSAIAKKPALSLGNIIGANILDLTLVLGIIVIAARGIKIKEKGVKRDSRVMLFMVILPFVLFIIGNSISRLDGLILLAAFFVYTCFTLKTRKRNEKKSRDKIKGIRSILLPIVLFFVCLALLFISANAVVKYASSIALELNLPAIVIGIFLVSLGTTLPELSFGVSAALLKQGHLSLADQIGTVIFNATFIVGITALIHPISATFAPFILSSIFLIISSFLAIIFIESGKMLSAREGIFLVLLYILFAFVLFFIK